MGVTWAIAWSSVGFIPRWVLGMESDLPFPILFAGLGFIAGVTFSGILLLTDGRRRFDQMSIPRFAARGAAGGLLLAALFVRGVSYTPGEVFAISAMFAGASAVCASGTLALARRAARMSLPEGGGDVSEAELGDPQSQERLGSGS
jgi:hypothetical protein